MEGDSQNYTSPQQHFEKLEIENLPYTVTDAQLTEMLQDFHGFKKAYVHLALGFGLFETEDDVRECIDKLKGKMVDSHEIYPRLSVFRPSKYGPNSMPYPSDPYQRDPRSYSQPMARGESYQRGPVPMRNGSYDSQPYQQRYEPNPMNPSAYPRPYNQGRQGPYNNYQRGPRRPMDYNHTRPVNRGPLDYDNYNRQAPQQSYGQAPSPAPANDNNSNDNW